MAFGEWPEPMCVGNGLYFHFPARYPMLCTTIVSIMCPLDDARYPASWQGERLPRWAAGIKGSPNGHVHGPDGKPVPSDRVANVWAP